MKSNPNSQINNRQTMASLPLLTTASALVLVHLLCFFTPIVVSQSPISPTIAQCSTSLLPLASCGPFVQGTAENPSQSCCDNLQQLNAQQPECLCLLLNDSAISRTFPINRTLALQLPSLCDLPMKASTCLGSLAPSTPAASSPSPASLETGTNSSSAASPPVVSAAPRPAGRMGLMRSAGLKLEKGRLLIIATAAMEMALVLV